MLSVRDTAADCLGVTGDISVDSDIYGYITRDSSGRLFGNVTAGDVLPATGEVTTRSLKAQLNLARGNAINVCIFLVGHEYDNTSQVSTADMTETQYALQVMRDIYAQAGIGIREIFWRRIGVAKAGSYINISGKPEAIDLTDDFSGPNDGIDVFIVQSVGGADGWCNNPGPCDKDAKDDMTGVVMEVTNGHRVSGVLMAHEVGHYMGLPSGPSSTNFMGTDADGDGVDSINTNSTGITNGQAATMLGHCAVNGPC